MVVVPYQISDMGIHLGVSHSREIQGDVSEGRQVATTEQCLNEIETKQVVLYV